MRDASACFTTSDNRFNVSMVLMTEGLSVEGPKMDFAEIGQSASPDHVIKTRAASAPSCAGTGFVTLDWVINDNDPDAVPASWAGGSCGNVMCILAYLGWECFPIARLGNDTAARRLFADFETWNVKTTFISQSPGDNTPLIVQRIGVGYNGIPWHRFEWTCPDCGAFFPKYKPVLNRDVPEIMERMPSLKAFYFDRVAPSSIQLAKASKEKGALVVFEPSSIKDDRLFAQCLEVADVVKYSHDRLGHIQELAEGIQAPLQIETLGAQGLRFRLGGKPQKWETMSAFSVQNLEDAAGSGDWCSAGIIHTLTQQGSPKKLNRKSVQLALRFGQALAAVNCRYQGARGSMYNLTRLEFEASIHELLKDANQFKAAKKKAIAPLHHLRGICPSCVTK